jgi:hypothetical protein
MDMCLTVSSLLSTESFMSTATNCRCCQPAYFPGLHCLRECICVTWLLTESRARLRECVCIIRTPMEMQYASQYFMCTPVNCSDVFMYSVYSHYFILHMYIPVMCMPVDVCSIDVLLREESPHIHWQARTRRTQAHAKALQLRQWCV